MVRTIDVPEDVDRFLASLAEREGTSVEALTVEILRRSASEEPLNLDDPPRLPADVLELWRREGVIGSRTDITDSVAHARSLRETAQRRKGSL